MSLNRMLVSTILAASLGVVAAEKSPFQSSEAKVNEVTSSAAVNAVAAKTSFAKWKNCVSVNSSSLKIVYAPDVSRLVYFGPADGSQNLLWLDKSLEGKSVSAEEASKKWSDFGGVRTWLSPAKSVFALTQSKAPQPYEIEGAATASIEVKGNSIIASSTAQPEYGVTVTTTYTINGSKLEIKTDLIANSTKAHKLLIGPTLHAQFVHPEKVEMIKSTEDKHVFGYLATENLKVDVDEEIKTLTFAPLKDAAWELSGRQTGATLHFADYTLTTASSITKGEYFAPNNISLTVAAPTDAHPYIELSQFGTHGKLEEGKLSTTVTWTLEGN